MSAFSNNSGGLLKALAKRINVSSIFYGAVNEPKERSQKSESAADDSDFEKKDASNQMYGKKKKKRCCVMKCSHVLMDIIIHPSHLIL